MSDGITDMMREMMQDQNCTKCKYFQSYFDMYDGDGYEPTDAGRCLCQAGNLFYEGVTDEDTCKYFELLNR